MVTTKGFVGTKSSTTFSMCCGMDWRNDSRFISVSSYSCFLIVMITHSTWETKIVTCGVRAMWQIWRQDSSAHNLWIHTVPAKKTVTFSFCWNRFKRRPVSFRFRFAPFYDCASTELLWACFADIAKMFCCTFASWAKSTLPLSYLHRNCSRCRHYCRFWYTAV